MWILFYRKPISKDMIVPFARPPYYLYRKFLHGCVMDCIIATGDTLAAGADPPRASGLILNYFP
jgi:hypothetical protein